MLIIENLSLSFGGKELFKDVNLKLSEGNCYGVIGANGAGKSTFLKVLVGEVEPSTGSINYTKNERVSFLRQNHNAYNEFTLIETVIMGNEKLYNIMKEKDELYSKTDFTEEDGYKAGVLEDEFMRLNGWDADSDAGILLNNLGIDSSLHYMKMEDIKEDVKMKVLLAKTLFQNPEILLLDEPTNYLDIESKIWLEEFLINYENTVVVVSHDRHFLNKVCTNMLDIDYQKITQYVGNYDFWQQSSELMLKQIKESNKKKEDKKKELQDFIARFSANASKSKQATSRKKLLEKIELDELKPSTRRYPYINFEYEKTLGKDVLHLKDITYTLDDKVLLNKVSFSVYNNDKIAIISNNEFAKTALLDIIASKNKNYTGDVSFGSTVVHNYFEKNHDYLFQDSISIFDWLSDVYKDKEQSDIRAYLGRMLFAQDDALKHVNVLSGGEKVRSLFTRIMMSNSNFLLFDEPTNHLDIESITSLNKGLINFKGAIIFTTYDYELINTTANRIIEIKDDGKIIDKICSYDEYLEWKRNNKKN